LIYVPLKLHGQVIGVLGVDNRRGGHSFEDRHIPLLSMVAGYAVIAIENARLYNRSEVEREKLETILTQIDDGVIVIDPQSDLVLVNRTARKVFEMDDSDPTGRPALEVISHEDLTRALNQKKEEIPHHFEIEMEDGCTFSAQLTPIPDVGRAITMQDITHFKELDRIKSDFVNTVSHDLRSPLTAILGYVELIERSGPISDQQREFIRRVQFSVKNITELINNLLDLGRIEAGLDMQKERVPTAVLINYALDGLQQRIQSKKLKMSLDFGEDLPRILGNPIRLRQMFDNLLENAIKYTPEGGEIRVGVEVEGDQMILQFEDTGIGIPLSEQPYIFDKLYRASNVAADDTGTGLGLSIVKSIVESHHGRIWVESVPGEGSTFYVVLPLMPTESPQGKE
jgi:two-component system NtrC family sensor kinase